MELSGISSNSGVHATGKKDNQTLDKDDFLQLLVTQLKYQDPLNPMEDREFIAQTAQFSSLEQMQNMNKNLEEGLGYLIRTQQEFLLSYNSWQAMGSGLEVVGKEVVATTDDGEKVTGLVEKVRFSDKGPIAVINGQEIVITNITEICLPENSAGENNNESNSETEAVGETNE